MKCKIGLPIIGLFLIGLMSSCSNQLDSGMASKMSPKENSFSSSTVTSKGTSKQSILAPVDLGVAGNFVILSKTGVTDVYQSSVTGNVGSSPITGAAILLKCSEVAGTIYTVDAAGPLPSSI